MAEDYYKVKRFEEIYQDMKDYLIANQNTITDLNEGGGMASQLEAFAGELEEYYSRTKLGFIRSLINLPYTIFGFSRLSGIKANGGLIFSTAPGEPATGNITIPSGTLVATSSGIQFETTEEGTILSGNEDSSSISAKAIESGVQGNVPGTSINTIVTVLPNVENVNNPNPFTGGVDEETESEFKQRFAQYINGLGKSNTYGIRAGARGVEGVRSAGLIEHFPPKSGIYNFTLYIDDGSGEATAGLLNTVESVIDGDGTADNPGYRAVGINVEYLAPTKVTVDVDITVTPIGGAEKAAITYNIENRVTQLINGKVIGEDVILHQLTSVIMQINGVINFSYTSPASDVSISEDQVARVGTISVSYV